MSKKQTARTVIRIALTVILAAGVLCGAWFGIQSAGKKLTENGRDTTEENLRRGAVACYALEGRYPESLEYLTEHYNITVDDSKYYVYYTVFASNIMPDITVAVK